MQKYTQKRKREEWKKNLVLSRGVCSVEKEREREGEERKWKMERNFSLSATVLRGRRSRNEEV